MTTIAAVIDGNKTWIASDTMASSRGRKMVCGPKWVRYGDWAIGIAGALRTNSICAKHAKRLMDDLAGAFDFTERLEALLREYNYDLKPAADDAVPNSAQDMILACPGNIWSICSEFSIIAMDNFWADGSGGGFAMGALRATSLTGRKAVEMAISVSMEFDKDSGGEVWVDVLLAPHGEVVEIASSAKPGKTPPGLVG